jgi:hypothetical protein
MEKALQHRCFASASQGVDELDRRIRRADTPDGLELLSVEGTELFREDPQNVSVCWEGVLEDIATVADDGLACPLQKCSEGPVIGCRAAFLMQLYCHNEVPTKSNTNIVTSPTSLSSRRGSNILRDLPYWAPGADVSTRSRPSFQSLSPEMCLCGAVCNEFVRMVHTERPFQVCSVSFECLVSPSA